MHKYEYKCKLLFFKIHNNGKKSRNLKSISKVYIYNILNIEIMKFFIHFTRVITFTFARAHEYMKTILK